MILKFSVERRNNKCDEDHEFNEARITEHEVGGKTGLDGCEDERDSGLAGREDEREACVVGHKDERGESKFNETGVAGRRNDDVNF